MGSWDIVISGRKTEFISSTNNSDSIMRYGRCAAGPCDSIHCHGNSLVGEREAGHTCACFADRQTDTTPRKAGHMSHVSIATSKKKVPFAFGDQLLTGRDGTLLCSAGPEWYGYHGIIDTEASTWAPASRQQKKTRPPHQLTRTH